MNAVSCAAAACGSRLRAAQPRCSDAAPATDIKFCAIDDPDCEACQ